MPDPRWPGGAKVAVQVLINYEEGAENNVLHGDPASESLLSEFGFGEVVTAEDVTEAPYTQFNKVLSALTTGPVTTASRSIWTLAITSSRSLSPTSPGHGSTSSVVTLPRSSASGSFRPHERSRPAARGTTIVAPPHSTQSLSPSSFAAPGPFDHVGQGALVDGLFHAGQTPMDSTKQTINAFAMMLPTGAVLGRRRSKRGTSSAAK